MVLSVQYSYIYIYIVIIIINNLMSYMYYTLLKIAGEGESWQGRQTYHEMIVLTKDNSS